MQALELIRFGIVVVKTVKHRVVYVCKCTVFTAVLRCMKKISSFKNMS